MSKKTGVLCPIIDLSCLNHHLVIPQFKMETQASVRLSIKESKWTMSISAPQPLYRPELMPIWSCECCSTQAGWSISASLICHPASGSISSAYSSSMCTNTVAPLPKMGVDGMPALWSRMGMVYALLPFKMLPAVFNNIGSSHDLSVILVALVAHHGCQSYSSSLDVFPYHWKVIHFSHKKFECLEVTLRKTLPTLKSTRVATLRDLFVKLGHSQGITDCISTNMRASLIGSYEFLWSRSVEYCRRNASKYFR